MNQSDREKVLEVLTGVHDFYGKEMSTFAGQVWMQALAAFEREQITKALSAHLMDADRGQFMPKPADIVRQLQGTATDRSLIAWGKVLDAIQRVGAYQSVVFDDGAIHAAISDMGGWVKVCRTTHDELPFVQKRFTDAHKTYTTRPDLAYPAKLIGESEQTNGAHGYKAPPPVLIGAPEVAQQVAARGIAGPKTQITHATESVAVRRIVNAA